MPRTKDTNDAKELFAKRGWEMSHTEAMISFTDREFDSLVSQGLMTMDPKRAGWGIPIWIWKGSRRR